MNVIGDIAKIVQVVQHDHKYSSGKFKKDLVISLIPSGIVNEIGIDIVGEVIDTIVAVVKNKEMIKLFKKGKGLCRVCF